MRHDTSAACMVVNDGPGVASTSLTVQGRYLATQRVAHTAWKLHTMSH